MSGRLFALIIGIDRYKSGNIWDLHSCVEDATNVKNWLVNSLRVPKSQICLLLDDQATKQNIEDSFMTHLVNNPAIGQNDAILIYFAGHGSNLAAPLGWYDGQVSSPARVQLLCPYDHDTKSAQGRISGISDRSIRALLDDLSAAKGDNITFVLDCCFNPTKNASNIRDRSFTRWTETTKAKSSDLYRDLWVSARGHPKLSKSGLFSPPLSHVFLAACPQGDAACEGKEGGRFTTAFLHALTTSPLHRTSYSALLESMMRISGATQNYSCLGKQKERVLFDEVPFVPDPQFFPASVDLATNVVKIEMGAIHGIVEGTEVSLYLHNRRSSLNPSFTPATVIHLDSTTCIARPKAQLSAAPKSCWAKVTRWKNQPPLRVKLKSTFTSFFRMWRLRRRVPKKAGNPTSGDGFDVVRVRKSEDADISLTVHRHSVAVHQHTLPLPEGSTTPTVNIPNKSGLDVIDSAARFNHHLLLKNVDNPLQHLVRMELFQLHPTSWASITPNLLSNHAAIIPYQFGDIYRLDLHNTSKHDLWPYLVFMDPSSYRTTMLYQPEDTMDKAPLSAGGRLEIGSEQSGSEALSFKLADAKGLNSGFLKLFLASTPVAMDFHEQDPSILWTPTFEKGNECSEKAAQHVWDTDMATVTFVRDPSTT